MVWACYAIIIAETICICLLLRGKKGRAAQYGFVKALGKARNMEAVFRVAIDFLMKIGVKRPTFILFDTDEETKVEKVFSPVPIDKKDIQESDTLLAKIRSEKTKVKAGKISNSLVADSMGENAVAYPLMMDGVAHGAFLAEKEAGRFVYDLLLEEVTLAIMNARYIELREKAAKTDSLTGLYNHRTFYERLGKEMEFIKSKGLRKNPISALILDIDFFKKVNDDFGHPAGDEVLKQVAKILGECVRATDIVARYGGEEFAVVLPLANKNKAAEVAERIRANVEGADFPVNRKITVSIGVAAFPEDGKDPQTLMKVADEALYSAKEGGRNRICG